MSKTLEMVFSNTSGKNVTVSVVEPKDNLTLAEVNTVMQAIISKNIFSTTTGDLSKVVEARIRNRDVAVLV